MHFRRSGEHQHTTNKGKVEWMCNIVILKRIYMHDLAKNIRREGKIILPFLLPLKVQPF